MNSIKAVLDMIATEAAEVGWLQRERVYFGVPGHCYDIDNYLWHEPGKCPTNGRHFTLPNDRPCCGYREQHRDIPRGEEPGR